ncbi:hypothetical protein D3C87_1770700 [compost metagenome]
MRATLGLTFVHTFAEKPEIAGLRLGRGDDPVEHQTILQHAAQEPLHQIGYVHEARARDFHQDIGGIFA